MKDEGGRMRSLLDRDLVKGNILDVIREYRERLEILERLVWESGSGEGGQAVAEGPDIDLVYSGGTAVIGRGGDTILLFDSGGNPVAEWAATNAGLVAAVAAISAGDILDLPYNLEINATAAVTISTQCVIRNANIKFSGFSGVGLTISAVGTVMLNSRLYFDGTGRASATALKTTTQCKLFQVDASAYYATTNVGLWLIGSERYKRAHAVSCIGDARFGTTNIGIRMDDYSFAQNCLGFAATTGTDAASAYGIQHYSTLTGEDGGFTLACSGSAFGSEGATVANGAIWSAGKTGREISSSFYSIGGGTNVDLVIEAGATAEIGHCTYGTSTIGGTLTILAGGEVSGPASSTDHAVARWNGITGDAIQDSGVILDDSDNMDFGAAQIRDYAEQTVATSQGAAYAIDWSAGNLFEVTLTGDVTFTFSNLVSGKGITVTLIQDGTGSRTVTWPVAVTWLPAAPTLQTAAASIDVVTLFVRNDGASVLGFTGQSVVPQNLDDLDDVDTTGVGTGAILYKSAGDWIDYPLGIGTAIVNEDGRIKIGDIAGGNYFEVDNSAGEVTLIGDATAFDDLVHPLIGEDLESPASDITIDHDEGAVVFDDDCTLVDFITVNTQLSHRWKIGSAIEPHLHWWQASANVPNWLLQYRWQIQGAAKTTAWTDVPYSDHEITYVSGTINQITSFGEIAAPDGAGLSDIVQCRILRDTDNDSEEFGADPLVGDVSAVQFDIHIEIDSFGSYTRYTKNYEDYMLLESGDIFLLESGDRLILE